MPIILTSKKARKRTKENLKGLDAILNRFKNKK